MQIQPTKPDYSRQPLVNPTNLHQQTDKDKNQIGPHEIKYKKGK
jgi:hypothetical protein